MGSREAARGRGTRPHPERAGGWTLHGALGSGGSATVYRATRGEGETSALKVMHAHLSADRAWLRRVRREAALLQRIDHPAVARVLDAGSLANGVPYIALELLDGRSLEVLRRERGGRLPVREALELVRGVLRALSAVHAVGIVHRDLKPSNVFVTSAGELKVLDFGIAAASDSAPPGVDETAASTTRGILGTPAFMSPEQARGRWDRVDERSDLWAVGAMLFTLVSGEFVHVAGTENERLGLAMSRPARSLLHVMPSAGAALSGVVARALAYEQNERFQSAAEFLSALSSLGEGECSPEPADVTVRDVSAVAREPRLRSALLVAAAVLGVMSALALSLRSQASGAAAAPNPHAPAAAAPARAAASPAPRSEPTQRVTSDAPVPAGRAPVSGAGTAPASASSVRQAPPPPAMRVPRRTVAKSEATNEQAQVKTGPEALRPGEDLLGVRTGPRATAHEPAPDPLERRD